MSVLLDPTLDPAEVDSVSRAAEQDLFLRFALAEYGKEILPPFLRAVFTAGSAEELIRQAFGQEPEEIERQWQAWLE